MVNINLFSLHSDVFNSALPDEAIKFAKQMGLNLKGMEAEVSNLKFISHIDYIL
jgi:hypothetical protein